MGYEPVYSKPRLSVPGQDVSPYPYLLRDRAVTAPNEVWSTDITYVPMPKGFPYPAAVLYRHSRYVPSWQLSNTLDVGLCLLALTQALHVAPALHIFKSDEVALRLRWSGKSGQGESNFPLSWKKSKQPASGRKPSTMRPFGPRRCAA